jgi:hypothetical protein
MGFFVVYLIMMKWLWDPHVGIPKKNIVKMGVYKIVEQMGKINPKNLVKIVILEKWLIVTPNWRCYEHPLVALPNFGADLTSFECHEPLFHTHDKLLHQMNED